MKEYFEKWTAQLIPWIFTHGLKILLILVGAYFIHKLAARFIKSAVRISVKPDNHSSNESEKKREDTLIRIFAVTFRVVLIILVGMMFLQEIGIMIGPILAGAGIVGLALGFGGQYIIRDLITGLFIILENQYRIGDVVFLNETSGLVEDISLRRSTLRDLDGTVHHIPHGEIKIVSNLSKTFARVNINVGVSYNANMDQVEEVVNRIGNDMASDPDWKGSIITPPRFLRIDDFADSSIIIKIVGDTQPLKQWVIAGEIRKRLLKEFNRAGIEIPFPQMVLHHDTGSGITESLQKDTQKKIES